MGAEGMKRLRIGLSVAVVLLLAGCATPSDSELSMHR